MKRIGFKRYVAAILTACLSVSMIPSGSRAMQAEQTDVIIVSGDFETIETEDYIPLDNEELFAGYFLQESGMDSGASMLSDNKLADRLAAPNDEIYRELKASIEGIAAGTLDSANISIDCTGLSNYRYYSAADLGLDSIVDSNNNITAEATDAVLAASNVDFNSITAALLMDCPYEMYWHNKSEGIRMQYSLKASRTNGQWQIAIGKLDFFFSVDSGYSANDTADIYLLDTDKTKAAQNAILNAAEIVNAAADMTDYQKLQYYRQQICDLVSYDYSAADSLGNAGSAGIASIAPWQIINVFDNDQETNVVCEGYSKAFKYLCDITNFDSELIHTYLVTGYMNENHMWNIVHMDNAQNYLVDITNCDSGSIGYDTYLFLRGFDKELVDDVGNITGYSIDIPLRDNGDGYYYPAKTITYNYDSQTLDMYYQEELILGCTDYSETMLKCLENAPESIELCAGASLDDESLSGYPDWEWEESYKQLQLSDIAGCSIRARAVYTGNDKDEYYNTNVSVKVKTVSHIPDPLSYKATDSNTIHTYNCSKCGRTIEENHTIEALDAEEADCIHQGKTEGSICGVCNKIIAEQVIVEPTGIHSYFGQEWLNDSEGNHYKECSVCGAMSEKTEHTFVNKLCECGLSDSVGPVVTFTPTGTMYKDAYENNVNIKINASDSVSGLASISYSVDFGDYKVISDGDSIELSKVGVSTVTVIATDIAGNTSKSEKTYRVYGNCSCVVTGDSSIYDSSAIEEGMDFTVSTGKSAGDITYSYKLEGEADAAFVAGLPVNAGKYLIKMDVAEDTENLYFKTESIFNFEIKKATPEYASLIPHNLNATCGDIVSDIPIDVDGFEFMDDTEVLDAGDLETGTSLDIKARYIPADTDNYEIVTNISIPVKVSHLLSSSHIEDTDTHASGCAGCERHFKEVACYGGYRDCVTRACCEVCGALYGDVDLTKHKYKNYFNWSEDKSSCTLTLICLNDENHITENLPCSVSSKIVAESTYAREGAVSHTAVLTYMGEEYSDTVNTVIAARDIPATALADVHNVRKGVLIEWQSIAGVDGYRIYREDSSGNSWLAGDVTGEKTTEYVDIPEAANRFYSYYVAAYVVTESGSYNLGAASDKISIFAAEVRDEAAEILLPILNQQSIYPEGCEYGDGPEYDYSWRGGKYTFDKGKADMAFAMRLSDAAFDDMPARLCYPEYYNTDNVSCGDIISVDTNSVIVLEKYDTYIVVAEVDCDNRVRWGRTITYEQLNSKADYMLTRYSEEDSPFEMIKITEIHLNKKSATIYAGEAVELIPQLLPERASSIKWTYETDDSSGALDIVRTDDSKGIVITGKKPGNYKVIVSSVDGGDAGAEFDITIYCKNDCHAEIMTAKTDVKTADCTNDGSYIEIKTCRICNKELSREKRTVKALGHEYTVKNNKHPFKPATYEHPASYYYACAGCGAKGTATYNFGSALSKTDISKCTVTLSATGFKYDGTAKEPEVTVKNGKIIIPESDYKVSYQNNISAGTARIIITAKTGNVSVSGNVMKTFAIAKADNKLTLTALYSKTAKSKAQSFKLAVKSVGGRKTFMSDNNKVSVNSGGKVKIAKNFSGKANITVTAGDKNYKTVKKKITVTVYPSKTSLKKVSGPRSKVVKLTWAKNLSASGYEIQYSTSKRFRKNSTKTVTVKKSKTTSLSLKKLKRNKKYYIRIRAYRTSGKTKLYSGWSATKLLER